MKIVFRADASTRIGTGHVMRCLALAQAWRRNGGSVVFASAEMTPVLEERVAGQGFQSSRLTVTPGTKEDAAKTAEIAKIQNASWVVADSYNFGLDYQSIIKAAGLHLLFLDDYGHAGEYTADLVLNQNLTANEALYARRAPHTRLLLGTRYVLFREEFLRWRDWKREISPVARKVLVTLGGSDPDNVTGKVIQALAGIADLEIMVVIGGSNPHLEELKVAIKNSKSQIRSVVDASNMPELMAWADVAIAAGGSTSWELAFMGLPNIMFTLADNQADIGHILGLEGVSVVLGRPNLDTLNSLVPKLQTLLSQPEHRSNMSELGRNLVDGNGVSRLLSIIQAEGITLRRALPEDSRLIWEWANDPVSRSASFASDPIAWENHVFWYDSKLRDENCFCYVAENGGGNLIGQIRIDKNGHEGIVSITLDSTERGKGFGAALIVKGAAQFFFDSNAELINAYIKVENLASIRAFKSADFQVEGTVTISGHQASHLVMRAKKS